MQITSANSAHASSHGLSGLPSSASAIPPPKAAALAPRERGPAKAPRESRAERWGPFSLSRIMRVNDQGNVLQIGWGANCNCHHNLSEGQARAGCKKQLQYGGLDDAACILQLKRWLLHGRDIPDEGEARRRHVEINARQLSTPTAAEVDAHFQ